MKRESLAKRAVDSIPSGDKRFRSYEGSGIV